MEIMKQYKLIKVYPVSPKVGYVLSQVNNNIKFNFCKGIGTRYYVYDT